MTKQIWSAHNGQVAQYSSTAIDKKKTKQIQLNQKNRMKNGACFGAAISQPSLSFLAPLLICVPVTFG